MSIDYSQVLKKQKTSQRFKKWMKFWDLGKVESNDDEINRCVKKINANIYDKTSLKSLALAANDNLEDLLIYINESDDEVSSAKLFEYILKFEKSWSDLKSRVIINEDEYFGKLLNILSEKESPRG